MKAVVAPVKYSFSTRRVWVVVSLILICYVVALFSVIPISAQYFSFIIGKQDYNVTETRRDDKGCTNSSSSTKERDVEIQKDASRMIMYTVLTTGIPSVIVCLIVGSYSDYIGRKPLLLVSVVGQLVKITLLALVIKLEWNRYIYLVGCVVDGLCGSVHTTSLAVSAIITDITPDTASRALNFGVIEGILFITGASAQVGVGYLIKESFFVSAVCCGVLIFLALILVVIFCPETMQTYREFSWNPLIHLSKVFGFYVCNGTSSLRLLYMCGISSFLLLNLTNLGRLNVETLFVMSQPICWDSVKIGYFLGIRLVITSVVCVALLRIFKYRLSLEVLAIICSISALVGFILEGFAKNTFQMVLSALIGILGSTCIPIPKALLSQLTSSTEQGALFSSMSSIESLSALISGTMYTIIYNSTISSFKGAVFMVMAALCTINCIFFGVFRYLRKFSSSKYELIVENQTRTHKQVDGELSNEATPIIGRSRS